MQTTLEDILRKPIVLKSRVGNREIEVIPNYKLSVLSDTPDSVRFKIEPQDHAGQSYTFSVRGNDLRLIENVKGE